MTTTLGAYGEELEGITNPPIDDLLEKVSSKYALAIYAAKCATSTPTALASQTPPPDILDKTRKVV